MPSKQPRIAVMRKGEVPSDGYAGTAIHWFISRKSNNAQELTLGQTTIAVGGRNPLHRHPNCEEALFVLSGQIEHVIEGSPNLKLQSGEAILIPRNLKHQAINTGATPTELLVAFSSPDRQTIVEE